METEIVIQINVFGEHYYPGAKLKRIAIRHPHEFGIAVRITEETPREIEWIELKENLAKTILDTYPFVMRPGGKFIDFSKKSCEEIAVDVAKIVSQFYIRRTTINVEELDESCGAILHFTKEDMEKLSQEKTSSKETYVS